MSADHVARHRAPTTPGERMNTRTIAVIALVLVIIVLAFLLL
ncbi:hypothetical protein [Nocardioides sp.]|nr:hypothetical protein [Nocardioides sp.]MDO9457087.1 hypothetical protein [Nocardioides sp.]